MYEVLLNGLPLFAILLGVSKENLFLSWVMSCILFLNFKRSLEVYAESLNVVEKDELSNLRLKGLGLVIKDVD